MQLNDENIKRLLSEAIYQESDIGKDVCDEIAFHMVDWKDELIALYKLLQHPNSYNSKEVLKIIQAFLIHATEHSIAASELLLGYEPENIFRK